MDVLDLVTDDLKQKLLPVNVRLKEMEKERQERRKVRGKIHKKHTTPSTDRLGGPAPPASPTAIVGGGGNSTVAEGMDVDDSTPNPGLDDDFADEAAFRRREEEELSGLVHPDLKADVGANVSGMYELVGS